MTIATGISGCRRAAIGLILLLTVQSPGLSQTTAGGSAAGQGVVATNLNRARSLLEGTFQLDEWHIGGKVLRPPVVEGRFSIHDGVILFMTVRHDGPAVETTHGWGAYRIDSDGWTYGYDHLETASGSGDGPFTRTTRPPSTTLLKLHWENDKLIVTGQGTDRREYTHETFVSMLNRAGDFRKWRRIE